MDTAFNMDISDSEQTYRISGKEEIKQRLYILLFAKKGGFIYDRELGSDIFTVDTTSSDCISEIEAKARKALEEIPDAEIVGVSVDEGKISVSVELEEELYELEFE